MVSFLTLSAGVFALFLAARFGRSSGIYALLFALIGAALILASVPGLMEDALPPFIIAVSTISFFLFR